MHCRSRPGCRSRRCCRLSQPGTFQRLERVNHAPQALLALVPIWPSRMAPISGRCSHPRAWIGAGPLHSSRIGDIFGTKRVVRPDGHPASAHTRPQSSSRVVADHPPSAGRCDPSASSGLANRLLPRSCRRGGDCRLATLRSYLKSTQGSGRRTCLSPGRGRGTD